MIEYLIFGLGAIIICTLFGFTFFKIIDVVLYVAGKLGDLMFGKEKHNG